MTAIRPRALATLLPLLIAGAAGCARTTGQARPPAPITTDAAPTDSSAPRALSAADLAPGTRIRYHVRGDWRGLSTGRVARATSDTVWLEQDRPLVVAQLRRLDVSHGGVSEARGMARGAIAGATILGLLAALAPRDSSNHHQPPSRAGSAALGAMYGGMLGGIVGLFASGERWERVALPPRRD